MIRALVRAVEEPPPAGTRRVIDVPGVRRAGNETWFDFTKMEKSDQV